MNTTTRNSEEIERIRERIANRKQEIVDFNNMIVDEKCHEHGTTVDEVLGILNMLHDFNGYDEERIERLAYDV